MTAALLNRQPNYHHQVSSTNNSFTLVAASSMSVLDTRPRPPSLPPFRSYLYIKLLLHENSHIPSRLPGTNYTTNTSHQTLESHVSITFLGCITSLPRQENDARLATDHKNNRASTNLNHETPPGITSRVTQAGNILLHAMHRNDIRLESPPESRAGIPEEKKYFEQGFSR